MTDPELLARIRSFIGRHVRQPELADGEDIFASGLVNSMFAMQLVQFVERDLGVTVEDEDLELDHFRSAAAVAEFVMRKRSAR
jgi:acyl carrier protein